LKRDGDELEIHYRHTLEELGKEPGLIGVIFRKAQNKIQDPAKLRRLIADLIDKEEWSSLDTDVKGDAYEGLLQKNAEDVKGGAGQYFTPRPQIRAIVDVMQPQPSEGGQPFTICDPACGTGGFLLAAHDYIRDNNKLDKKHLTFLNTEQLRGVELVDSVARLCCMNLVLHGIGAGAGQAADAAHVPVMVKDALAGKHGEYEMVLTNPLFGKKSSVTIVNEAGETVRRELLKQADVHTLLRLPPGIWYARGVKANVLFFDRKPAAEKAWTTKLWIYDLRTNKHFTLKENPLKRSDLDDFVSCYFGGKRSSQSRGYSGNRHERKESERFRSFTYEDLLKRDKLNLDIFWLKDESLEDSANLPDPGIIAQEIVEDLKAALAQFAEIANDLKR
jgi:type I restriction enzyme M protein